MASKACKASKQSKAMQSIAKQSKAKHSIAKQSKAKQSKAKQNKAFKVLLSHDICKDAVDKV